MGSGRLDSKVHRSIHEVSQQEWDSINSTGDIFHTYKFLKALEDAKVENSEYWYVLLYRQQEIVATAVISSFQINLDIFIGAEAFIKSIRRVWARFLHIKILMCGIPASFGQKNIVIKEGDNMNDCLRFISELMEGMAGKEKIKYLAFKEFKESEIYQYDILKSLGYFKGHSLPNMKLYLRWKDFNGYLNDLRTGYKRQTLASLKKNRSDRRI